MSMHYYITADPDRQLSFEDSEKVDKRYRYRSLINLCNHGSRWYDYERFLKVYESGEKHRGPEYISPIRMWADQEFPDVDYGYLVEFKEDVPMMGVIKDPKKILEICGFLKRVLPKHNDELPQCYEYQAPFQDTYYARERFWIHPDDWTDEMISIMQPGLKFIKGGRLKTYTCSEFYEEIVFSDIEFVCQKAIESNQDVKIYFA